MGGDTGRFRTKMNRTVDFQILRDALVKAGARAVSAVRADDVSSADRKVFERWLRRGDNAHMEYMNNRPDLRFSPQNLHEGTKYIICCAFAYAQDVMKSSQIASYALGSDYHKVIPKRIKEALRGLENDFYESVRICVDSAPVRERYWAVRSGLARRCDSGLVSVPGAGTRFFLTEILTPWDISGIPEPVMEEGCDHCGACRRACPGGAIREDGTIDSRRCVSYLTIEHKGEWSDEQKEIMNRPGASDRLFGCEICQQVCHLNRKEMPGVISEFHPRPELVSLDRETIAHLTPEEFNSLVRNSPLKRTGLDSLRRNAHLK